MADIQQNDSWVSFNTGLGDIQVDKTLSLNPVSRLYLPDEWLVNLYSNDHLAYRAVSALPKDALGLGFEVEGSKMETLPSELKRIQAHNSLLEGLTWERLFGGAAIWVGVADGREQDQPLTDGKAHKVLWLKPIDKRYIQPDRTSINIDPNSPYYDQPEFYKITSGSLQTGGKGRPKKIHHRIHRSRLLILSGETTTRDMRDINHGWGCPVLTRMYRALQRYNGALLAAGYSITEASYSVLKIQDLADLVAAPGKEEAIKQRLRTMQFGKSVTRTVAIGEGEEYDLIERTFSGLKDVIEMMILDVAAASGMPITRLFGRSPAGLNSTGESDSDNWYGQVDEYRTYRVAPLIQQLAHIITGEPELEVTFPELKPMSDLDRAEIKNKLSQAAATLANAQIFDPIEMAISLFEELGVEIDPDERRALLSLDPTSPEEEM